MNRGIYATASGMLVAQHWMDTIANNLANASTTGFKRDAIAFDEAMLREMVLENRTVGELGAGPEIKLAEPVFTQGPLQNTGNPLDVAIQNERGMFGLRVGNAIRYTRDGSFSLNQSGLLVTKDGFPVLTPQGQTITLPKGQVAIADDGNITVNGQSIAQIGVFDAPGTDAKTQGFMKLGRNQFVATSTPVTIKSPNLRQGAVEGSNVEAVDAMVQMISISRAFEMAQRSIQSQDELAQRLISSLSDR